jgi:malonyl-CoA/methylmalonyl-CoA synthetase
MNTSNPLHGPRLAGTVGPPLPGVDVRVVDESDSVLPPGQVGHVLVRGPNVFTGYWGMPERRALDFTADGFFRTGDLGRIDGNGYLALVGRAKDLVITGGYNVYPREIELVLDRIAGVRESAVFGVPDRDFGEAVTAAVVLESSGQLPDEAAILRSARERLASYKLPKRVHFVAELPRNAMGKVQKNELRRRFTP